MMMKHHQHHQQHQIQNFSTSNTKLKTLADYKNEKHEAKQDRTEQYTQKQTRNIRLKTRRDPTKANYNKVQFHSFFNTLKQNQEFLDREARRRCLDWNLRVSVMVERLPIIMPEKEEWEKDYEELRLYLDRFRPVYPKELGFRDPKEQDIPTDEEVLARLPKGYKPAPRITPADESGNIQTMERKLDRRLYLTINQVENKNDNSENTNGKSTSGGYGSAGSGYGCRWSLPTVSLQHNETLLDAGKRATTQYAGPDLDIVCMGFAPMGVYMQEYDDVDLQKTYFGDKTFYFKVTVAGGDVDESIMSNFKDWGWLDRSEISNKMKEERGEEAGKFYHYLL